ncbi:hypothetical protein RSAG8_09821, partial [Rhizoctonia solani AG-8 WAC10335]
MRRINEKGCHTVEWSKHAFANIGNRFSDPILSHPYPIML